MDEKKYIFKSSWFDNSAYLLREFYLTFYPKYGEVELFDIKNKRTFLKRTVCTTVTEQDLYLQNTVTIYSRKFLLVDYADNATKMKLESKSERTVVLLGHDSLWILGKFINMAYDNHLATSKLKLIHMNETYAQFLEAYKKIERVPLLDLMGTNVFLLELLGERAVEAVGTIIEILNSPNTNDHYKVFPGVLYHSVAIPRNLKLEEAAFASLSEYIPQTFDHCTCCIIKPHAVREGLAGKILMDIAMGKFLVLSMNMLELKFQQAKCFLAVYKGVLHEHPGLVTELSQGPCIAVCLQGERKENNIVQVFREFVGPIDPEIARKLRPGTLRAKYGSTKIKNCVHCTDLPEDNIIELEYLFKSLLYTEGVTDH